MNHLLIKKNIDMLSLHRSLIKPKGMPIQLIRKIMFCTPGCDGKHHHWAMILWIRGSTSSVCEANQFGLAWYLLKCNATSGSYLWQNKGSFTFHSSFNFSWGCHKALFLPKARTKSWLLPSKIKILYSKGQPATEMWCGKFFHDSKQYEYLKKVKRKTMCAPWA